MNDVQKNMDKWAEKFNNIVGTSYDSAGSGELADQPLREVFSEGLGFCDYRLSYGIKAYLPVPIYFLAVYPAFCTSPKFVCHYKHLSELALDVLEIEDFMNDPPPDELKKGLPRNIQTQDIIATAFAVLRGKESIELFQEQKDLMELGLRHVHLDNYYQDMICVLCKEYGERKTLLGKPFDLNIFKKTVQNQNG